LEIGGSAKRRKHRRGASRQVASMNSGVGPGCEERWAVALKMRALPETA